MENVLHFLSRVDLQTTNLVGHVIGIVYFAWHAVPRTITAFKLQGEIPVTRSKGFTDALIKQIDLLSKLYFVFLYTQVIIFVYGICPGALNQYLDFGVLGITGMALLTARIQAEFTFGLRWRSDPEKRDYLNRQLNLFGGTWVEVLKSIVLSGGLLAIPFILANLPNWLKST